MANGKVDSSFTDCWTGENTKYVPPPVEVNNRNLNLTRAELRADFEEAFSMSQLDFAREDNGEGDYVDGYTLRAWQGWISSYETYAGYVRG